MELELSSGGHEPQLAQTSMLLIRGGNVEEVQPITFLLATGATKSSHSRTDPVKMHLDASHSSGSGQLPEWMDAKSPEHHSKMQICVPETAINLEHC